MYFKTSYPSKQGDVGVFQSPVISGCPGLTCRVAFLYRNHFNGLESDLSVWIKTNSSNTLVWSKPTIESNLWLFASIQLSYGVPYQVLYSAGKPTYLYIYIYISIPIKEQCVFVCLFVFFLSATRHLSTLRRCLRVSESRSRRRERPRASGQACTARARARMPYNFSTKKSLR